MECVNVMVMWSLAESERVFTWIGRKPGEEKGGVG